MNVLRLGVGFVILFQLLGCAGGLGLKNGDERYYVSFGATYMRLKESDSYQTYPWILEEYKKSKRNEDGIEEVLVAHSCGLFETRLRGMWQEKLTDDLQERGREEIIAYVPGGEFCNISHFLSYGPKLVKIKIWNNRNYVLDYWDTKYDGDGRLFLFEDSAVKELGLAYLYKDIDIEKVYDACESLNYISPDDLKWALKQPNVTQHKDQVCYTKGVYLDEIMPLIVSSRLSS